MECLLRLNSLSRFNFPSHARVPSTTPSGKRSHLPQTATGGNFISSSPHSKLIHFLNDHLNSQYTSGPADTLAACDTLKWDKSGVMEVLRPTGEDAYRMVQSLFSHRWLDHDHHVGTPPPGMKNYHFVASEL